MSIAALALMGVFCLASAASPNWVILAALRFGAGAGAAFFFAPALGLVTSYYPRGSRGPIVGLYNAGFSIGSGIGLFGGAFVGVLYGWPAALAVGGVILLLSAAAARFVLPRTEAPPERRAIGKLWLAARPVMRSRALWALSVSFVGLWAAFYIASQYFVQYAHDIHPGWSTTVAAGLPTLMIGLEILGGPVGGWLGDRLRDMRWILALCGVVAVAMMASIPFAPLSALVPIFVVLGFIAGVGFAVLYLLPSYLPETQGEGLALGLALINAVQILAGSGVAIAFAYVAQFYGYTTAWLFAAVLAVATLPALLAVRGHLRGPAPRTPRGVSSSRPARPT